MALSVFALTALARPPKAPVPVDSLATQEILQTRLKSDRTWQKAIKRKKIRLKLLGRYARNEPFYRQLVDRFERADTTLCESDFLILYYGYAYRDEYHYRDMNNSWGELYENKHHAEAYAALCELLKRNPASLNLLRIAFGLGCEAGRPTEELNRIVWRLNVLMKHITLLGDGSKKRPIMLVSPRDIYTVMRVVLGVKQFRTKTIQSPLLERHCVMIGSEEKGSQVWFDTTFSWLEKQTPDYWAKLITEKWP